MPKRQKILIIITRAELGGAQNHIVSLVAGLHKQYEFVLCTGAKGELDKALASFSVKTVIIPSLDKKQFWGSVKGIAKLIKMESPDLVHTHSAVASFVGRIVAKLLAKKTLYTVHGWHFVPNAVPLRRILGPILELIARPFTDYWITVSEFDKQLGVNKKVINPAICKVIENGVADMPNLQKADMAIFKKTDMPVLNKEDVAAENLAVTNKGGVNVAFIGRATYQKNCMAALDIIKACDSKVSLTFFSANGDHLPHLKTAIETDNLAHRVTLVDNENAAGDKLHQFDLLLMTSNYEGMPLCGLEAMRAGIPIVSSDVCGMSEIVNHGENGYLFELNDLQAATNHINELLLNPEKRTSMGLAARVMFEENHLEEQMVAKTQQVYEELLRK